MGLSVEATGLDYDDSFDCGYITFGNFRIELVKACYGEKMSELYKKDCFDTPLTLEEVEYWNAHCDDALDTFLFHSDCDGKFTWQECRDIYKAIEPIHMDMIGHNYGTMKQYNMLDQWKGIFRHCWKRRVNLYFM